MTVLGPVFTCVRAKTVDNVQKQVNKESDVPVLVKFLKYRHL